MVLSGSVEVNRGVYSITFKTSLLESRGEKRIVTRSGVVNSQLAAGPGERAAAPKLPPILLTVLIIYSQDLFRKMSAASSAMTEEKARTRFRLFLGLLFAERRIRSTHKQRAI
jgi:hypothetical protein